MTNSIVTTDSELMVHEDDDDVAAPDKKLMSWNSEDPRRRGGDGITNLDCQKIIINNISQSVSLSKN